MRKLLTLNKDEQTTLILLSKLNSEILTNGLTRDNADSLLVLQDDLLDIIDKIIHT